ncbi:MAG: VanZ family protein [Gammaproteobacteria bacterium]
MRQPSQTFLKILVLVVLCVSTILFFNCYNRYNVVGIELLANADFHQGLSHWAAAATGPSISEKGGMVALSAASPSESVSLSQTISNSRRFKLLRLSCTIKTQNVVGGDEYWKAARIALVQRNARDEDMYFIPHILTSQWGSTDWQTFEKTFAVHPDTTKIATLVQLVQSTGVLQIKSCSLRPIALKASFQQYRVAILLVWLGVILWVTFPIVRSGLYTRNHTVIMILAAGIIVGVLLPENIKEYIGSQSSYSIATGFLPILPTHFNDTDSFRLSPLLPTFSIYKAGHFAMFMLLAIAVFGGGYYKSRRLPLFSYLVLFAFTTEVLQLFMEGRTAALGDFIVDSLGIMLGLTISSLWKNPR